MKDGLTKLDALLERRVTLIIGGGGAMILAHGFPLATTDIDAVPKGMSIEELRPLIEKIAIEMQWPGDWLNPWYATFTFVLPEDFQTRLLEVFRGKQLVAQALGKEDLLLMKCFAHRQKDIPHARALLRAGANTELVFDQIDLLESRKIPRCDEAREFLEELIDQEEA